jgi:antitoxin component YwqK of YwqJK toxin-antitoxin module
MATVNKNFKIKNGLVVEGATATVNGNDVLTKSAADTTYIQGLVGGVANSQAVANAIVLRDANASFAANVVTADLVGDVTGTVSDISNHDTDALAEGTTNKYFSNTLARDAFSAGTGITLSSGEISVTSGTYDAAGSADTAQTNAQNYADGLASNYDAAGSADTAQTNAVNIANDYTDEVVANLVGSAPDLLDTLQELATALDDNPNVIADLQDIAAGKQDALIAGTGIDIAGNTISVTASTYDAYGSADTAQTNAQNYADSLAGNYDSSGSASTAQTNAQNYADSLASNYDASGSASTAQTNAQNYADSLSSNYDASGSASTAQTNAQNYADSLATNYDPAGSAANAQSAAESYADGLASNYDASGSASTAQTNAQNYADSLASNYDASGSASTAQTNAQNYADSLASNYDPAGSANTVAGDLSTHEGLTSGVHGVTGNVVGTTDTQDLSNKRIIDTLFFTDGVTISNEAEIRVESVSHDFEVTSTIGNLHLKANNNVTVTSQNGGDIVLNANGLAYITSSSAGNEIATHSYVDNAISGLDWKNAVHVKIDSNVNNLSAAAGTYDGHTLTTADAGLRVLLVGQSINSQNGIYVISNVAGDVVLTRSADADAYTELLGAAVYVAEGDQYGGTSWVQSNAYLTDFTGQNWTQFSGQGSVTAGSGITVDGLEVSVDRTTVDTWYDLNGAAANAQSAAEDYADGLASNYDAAGSADTAQTNAVTLANSYTDSEINDLTTDDIEQGSTNLYFSNSLAVGALEAVTPNFQSVDITWVRREEATWTDANTAGTFTAHTFGTNEGSVKYLVRIFNNGESQVSEVLVTTDSSNNIAVTEYAIIYTSENPLATITADWSAVNSEYRLRVTTANNNSEILVAATLVAYND